MHRDNSWLDHLRSLADTSRDLTVYGQSWAHDVRCLRTGTAHRRVGSVNTPHEEWLQAGLVARSATPFA